MTVGILTEKPSQAANFAKALGGKSGVFDGIPYVITNARGHVYEFLTPEKQVANDKSAKYADWSIANLPWDETDFSWKRQLRGAGYASIKNAKSKKIAKESYNSLQVVVKNIKSAFANVDEIVIATDDDPTGEGDLIGWEIIENLKFGKKKISRMRFPDETPDSIRKAFKERKVTNSSDPIYIMADYRSKWDFLSMQWTRAATQLCGGQLVRLGRLKSGMVSLVGKQFEDIAAYKPIERYQRRFKDELGVEYTDKAEPIYDTKEQVPTGLHDSAVEEVSRQTKSSAPPKLIDLATLSAILSPRGIDAKTVINTYQNMYNSQVVSYPRTEDHQITVEQFNELLPHVDKIAKLVGVDPALLTHTKPRSTHMGTGLAHGANRPGPNVPDTLGELDKYGAGASEIYQILAKSYLAMLAPDYKYEHIVGRVKDFPSFVGSVNVALSQGWREVLSDLSDKQEDLGSGLGKLASPFVKGILPPKPQKPTMRWLMKQLEKYNVGTGATRTSTYAEVSAKTASALMKDARGKITLTQVGEIAYSLTKGTQIADLGVTARLYEEMHHVFSGELRVQTGLANVADMLMSDIDVMKRNSIMVRKDFNMSDTVEKAERASGTWNGEEISFKRVYSKHRFTDEEVEALLVGQTIEAEFTFKDGKTHKCRGKLERQEYNGHEYVGFKIDFESSPPTSWCGHTFSADELATLEKGGVVDGKGFKSKAGKTFDAKITFGLDSETGRKRIMFAD